MHTCMHLCCLAPLQLFHRLLEERHPGSQLLLVPRNSRQLALCFPCQTLLLKQLLAQLRQLHRLLRGQTVHSGNV